MQKDELSELEASDKPIKVNVHQSGAFKASKESK
uniref:AlNc14C1040G12738 protein n=1 Tax=Albugo laibachii Nc14 TaxID=890382 RepID=F0X2G4_9STRA|nr:AlNc14C1040G12738 [Albugo laibachii Nc14]|eukprot:CCA28060.1 AlNc14C1040G12738 [Albugo laibachii Nc14]